MRTLKEEWWSIKLFFKYYFKQINLLKIFIYILIGLLIIIKIFINSPWNDRIVIFGALVILIVLVKQYLIGDHTHLYRIEMAEKIKEKIKEEKSKETLNSEVKEETTTKEL